MTASAHQISFILDKVRYQQDFLIEPAEAEALNKRLDAERDALEGKGFDFVTVLKLSDLSVRELDDAHEPAGSAVELLETITSAVSVSLEGDVPEDLKALLEEAQSLDTDKAVIQANPEDLVNLEINFTWDNDGDDNAFTQRFQVAHVQTPAADAFVSGLEEWLLHEGHAYDLTVGPADTDVSDRWQDALRELAGTLKDNSEGSHDTLDFVWGEALEKISGEDLAPKPEEPTVKARRSRRPG